MSSSFIYYNAQVQFFSSVHIKIIFIKFEILYILININTRPRSNIIIVKTMTNIKQLKSRFNQCVPRDKKEMIVRMCESGLIRLNECKQVLNTFFITNGKGLSDQYILRKYADVIEESETDRENFIILYNFTKMLIDSKFKYYNLEKSQELITMEEKYTVY